MPRFALASPASHATYIGRARRRLRAGQALALGPEEARGGRRRAALCRARLSLTVQVELDDGACGQPNLVASIMHIRIRIRMHTHIIMSIPMHMHNVMHIQMATCACTIRTSASALR